MFRGGRSRLQTGVGMVKHNGSAGKYFILFMAISFLGWLVETVFFLICYGKYYDRGFMTLPFCTIYGFSFLLLWFLIGEPGGTKGRVKRGSSPLRYFLLCALIPTALELLTGWFFQRSFGLRLWSYENYRFHFRGYICLEYALLWGILIPPCMKYIFRPVKNYIFSLAASKTGILAAVLSILAAVDWAVNFSRQELLL